MNHKAEDAHHSSAAVVDLDGALGQLLLVAKHIPAEIEEAVTEITGELARLGTVGGVLHDKNLEEAHEGKDLEGALDRDLGGGTPANAKISKLDTMGDLARETNASGGDNMTKESKHGNTAVLDLDVAEAVKFLLGLVVDQVEGVPVSLGIDKEVGRSGLRLVSVDGGRGTASLSGSKGGGRAGKGSEDGNGLHVVQ